MKVLMLISLVCVFFTACKKDKFTTSPQIKYKSVSPNFVDTIIGGASPNIIFSITDAEGDLGITSTDTARIYIKNLFTQAFDSLDFPDLKDITKSDFKAEILASVGRLGGCNGSSTNGRVDTMYYEVYVKDFAKNQSNTIVTADPVFQQCP